MGGLTPDAYLYGAEFLRESTREMQQKRLDEFLVYAERDLETSAANRAQNVVNPEDALSLQARVDSQRRLLERLRKLRATGRIVLGIKPGENDIASMPDIILEDGDRFVVPFRPATVAVLGAVLNQNAFIHREGKSVKAYLRDAGGTSRSADEKYTFIIKADGSSYTLPHANRWFGGAGSQVLMPGDTVIVPERFERTGILKGLRDWSQVFAQFALGAAAVQVLTQ
jgi:hypothetical protein